MIATARPRTGQATARNVRRRTGRRRIVHLRIVDMSDADHVDLIASRVLPQVVRL